MSTDLLNRLDGSRTDQRLRDQMDRLDPVSKMDTMYPTALSRHKSDCSPPQSYKRTVKKKVDRRGRFRTQPITFMEIKVGRTMKMIDLITIIRRLMKRCMRTLSKLKHQRTRKDQI